METKQAVRKAFCHNCNKHYEMSLTSEPKEIHCPHCGSFRGVWSLGEDIKKTCKVCGADLGVIRTRVRHDIKSPKGYLIVAEESEDVKRIINHMFSHPEVRQKAREYGLIK